MPTRLSWPGFHQPKRNPLGTFLAWLLRLAALAAVLYGLWWAGSILAARRYFEAGMRVVAQNPAAATQDLEIAATLRPDEARYQAALGRALLQQQRYPAATEHLARAARLQPEDFGLWHDLGQTYLRTHNPAAAKAAFEQAVRIRPGSATAMVGLAEAAAQTGDWKSAVGPLQKLWQASPGDVQKAGVYARALVGCGQYEEALKVGRQARSRLAEAGGPPPGPRGAAEALLLAEGDAYRAQGHWGPAASAYLACLEAREADAEALERLRKMPAELARPIPGAGAVHGTAFSPDGTKLAFYRSKAGEEAGICVADVAGGEPRRLAGAGKDAAGETPAWSPDGKWLCYARAGTLRLVDLDGTGDRSLVKGDLLFPQLLRPNMPYANRKVEDTRNAFGVQGAPACSPDGSRVAYRASNPRLGSVTCVVEVASGRARSLHRPSGPTLACEGAFPPVWSPDGRVICGPLTYQQGVRGGMTLWSREAEVRGQLPLPEAGSAPPTIVRVLFSPNAAHLAVVTQGQKGRTNLLLARTDGTGTHPVAADVLPESLRWRDGAHLWFLRRPDSTPLGTRVDALICEVAGKAEPAAERFPVLPVGDWALSPDGTKLAVAPPGEAGGLWVLDLARLREA